MPTRERVEWARQLGLCTECGRRPQQSGRTLCDWCRRVGKQRWHRYHRRQALAKQNANALRQWTRCVMAALDAGIHPPPRPEPLTEPHTRYYWRDRVTTPGWVARMHASRRRARHAKMAEKLKVEDSEAVESRVLPPSAP